VFAPIDHTRILESLADTVVVADASDRVLWANRAIEQLLGWTPRELIGKPLTSLMPGRFREAHLRAFEQFAMTRQPRIMGRPFRVSALHRNGTEVDIELTLSNLSGPREPLIVAASLRDVRAGVALERETTELRVTQRRMAAQYEVMRALAQSSTPRDAAARAVEAIGHHLELDFAALFLMSEQTGRVRAREVWSTRRPELKELESMTWTSEMGPNEGIVGSVWTVGRPVLSKNVSHDARYARRRAAERAGLHWGIWVPIQVGGQTMGVLELLATVARTTDDEFLRGLVLVGTQIGEFLSRIEAQAALAREREWLATTLESIADGIVATDAEERVVLINGVAASLTGFTDADARGQPLDEILRLTTEESNGKTREKKCLVSRTGRRIPVSSAVAPIGKAGDGGKAGLVVVLRDETEARAREQERERLLAATEAARRQADAANRAKDDFLATMSHELRTPLNAILGWAALLRARAGDNEMFTRGLSVIDRNVRVQAKLIEDLLDVARLSRGAITLSREHVDLREEIRAAVDAARPIAETKSLALVVDLGDHPMMMSGDASRLQQIFWNLLSNAIKFTPAGGCVGITLSRIENSARVRVMDTGEGIDPEFIGHVFEPFRQEDASSTRTHGGLGVGLAVAYSLIELHGGTIRARSEGRGHGTTFDVVLPLSDNRVEESSEREFEL
jgi:PAS domain S-box-containing protein